MDPPTGADAFAIKADEAVLFPNVSRAVALIADEFAPAPASMAYEFPPAHIPSATGRARSTREVGDSRS
jgi:hypothetical protein